MITITKTAEDGSVLATLTVEGPDQEHLLWSKIRDTFSPRPATKAPGRPPTGGRFWSPDRPDGEEFSSLSSLARTLGTYLSGLYYARCRATKLSPLPYPSMPEGEMFARHKDVYFVCYEDDVGPAEDGDSVGPG